MTPEEEDRLGEQGIRVEASIYTDEERKRPDYDEYFDRKVEVHLPSDVWIEPEAARIFAKALLEAADAVDQATTKNPP